jgi:DNA-binding HxlR family transcriptional regulator
MQVETVPWPGPGDAFDSDCPARVVLDHVMSKWAVLVLVALREDGETRFSALRRRVSGVSEKMLAQTLRTLEADGFVHRDAQPVIPPRVDYSLTDRGTELVALLLPLFGWVVANADEIVGERGPAT